MKISEKYKAVNGKMSSQKIHCWTLERVPPDLATGPPFVLDNAQERIRVGRRETTNDKVRDKFKTFTSIARIIRIGLELSPAGLAKFNL